MTVMAPPFDDLETRDEETRRGDIEARLPGVLARAWERAPGWRRWLEAAGVQPADITSVHDLSLLPVLPKRRLQTMHAADPPFGGLLTVGLGEIPRLFMSPGPIYDPQHGRSDVGGFARALHAAGFGGGDIVLNTFSYHLTPAGHAFDSGAVSLGCVVVPAGVGNTEQQLQLLADVPVSGYIGTPSFLDILLTRAEPPWRFRTALVAGERLTADLREQLEERSGGRVSQTYGTADLGLIAYECGARDGYHLGESHHVEICDPATGAPLPPGETGEVVVTTFSDIYPMLRLGTGDLSRELPAGCRCGRTSRRLEGVLGRVGPGVKVRGMFVYDHHVTQALGATAGRLVVSRDGNQDSAVLEVESPCAVPEAVLTGAFRDAAKVRAEVRIVPAGTLPQGGPMIIDERTW